MILKGSVRRYALGVFALVAGALAATGPAAAQTAANEGPGLFFATSEIAQVLLSIAAVSFVVLAARAYGGEIGKALFVVGGGVIVFASWQLLAGATELLRLQQPPASAGSVVNLVVTILLLAGFYMLYETTSGHFA
ncbi:hypothetical protein ACFQL1_13875 [Halomicroarcula sp. GCM10025709]|uniref:hypothetical protein n=1 Tax=Haloarcula TaxID=2237 RepID=UPI0024C325B2|nr:hypothetical protein [Halomicroarcula sp. YJ-61-S]